MFSKVRYSKVRCSQVRYSNNRISYHTHTVCNVEKMQIIDTDCPTPMHIS